MLDMELWGKFCCRVDYKYSGKKIYRLGAATVFIIQGVQVCRQRHVQGITACPSPNLGDRRFFPHRPADQHSAPEGTVSFLIFMYYSIHFLDFPLPAEILGQPDGNENCRENARVGEKTGQRVLHPVGGVGNGQHEEACGQEIHAALLGKAPIQLPDDGCRREPRPHDAAQDGLQDDRVQLAPRCGYELRRDGV